MRVFISYRRADTAGHAGRLYDALADHFGRDNVFMDLNAIDSGQNFVEAIDAAVRSCDALLAIIGDEWLTSAEQGGRRLDQAGDFVRSEIAAALARAIPVFPVLVEGTSMPAAEALPDVLKPLAKRQAHELSDRRWSYDVESLIGAIEKLGGRQRAGTSRRARLALAAAVVVLAVVGSMWAPRVLRNLGGDAVDGDAARGAAATAAPPPAVAVSGDWTADVTYSWGDTHPERFTLRQDGTEVFGTASYLRVRRGILDGTINGNVVQFRTQTEMMLGSETRPVTHRYRGRVAGDTIAFTLQSESAGSSESIEFTASRQP
jgi:hypothetical protein